jgi:membrane protein DedA with SNARE-associated domain
MDNRTPQKKKQSLADYGKYAGTALQMGVIIALGVWGGATLDEKYRVSKFPLFTVILSLFSVFAAMYFVIRDISKK